MDEKRWNRWAMGIGCPFCAPRPEANEYWDFIVSLKVSSLYLSSNQTYRGHCLLILDIRHATRPDQLSSEEWTAFSADLHVSERMLMETLQPDHVNLEIMGNVIPHLHWQIVPRYRTDPRWGGPIWTITIAEMPVTELPIGERIELVQKLRGQLTVLHAPIGK